jgi:serine O-acetyltransferase
MNFKNMKPDEELFVQAKNRFAEDLYRVNDSYCSEVPSMKETQRWVRDLVNLLFPIKENGHISLHEIEAGLMTMKLRLEELLAPLEKELQYPLRETVSLFFDGLPAVYRLLIEDAQTFVKSDPAAEKLEEVIICYPGFFSLVVYRVAHILYKLKVPVMPRVITEYAHGKTGIDIHPGAIIGKNCFIDHGTGIVIGETTVVGNNVKIYQGVTLGALFVKKNMTDTKRHPTIEDNVILYAGSTILGGKTVIGHDTIIGGNVWLTKSVPPHYVVYQENKTVIRENNSSNEPIHFVI